MRRIFLGLTVSLALVGCTGESDGGGASAAETSTSGGPDSTTVAESSTGDASSASATEGPSSAEGSTTSGPNDDTASNESSTTGASSPVVTLETTLGDIVLALDDVAAPITTANFLAYVEAGFYDGTDGLGATIFHRVIPNFMIQGGGHTETMAMKATMPPIVNESGNGLSNVRGSIAMARTNDPDSATAQFFINVADNLGLDDPPGYAVFGEVIEGMDVVDAVVAVETTSVGNHNDVPVEPIVILSATVR